MRSMLCIIGNFLSILYAKVFLITVVCGNRSLPEGPKIFVVNHPSTLDPFYFLGIMGERVSILITEHVFNIPVLGKLVQRAGHIKVPDQGGDVYARAKKTLGEGRSLLVFAEGEISHSASTLRKFHTGAVRLSFETGVPIVPVGIHLDQTRIWKRRTVIKQQSLVFTWYRYGWYTVVFGAPMYLRGSVSDRTLVRKETVAVRRQVAAYIKEAKRVVVEDRLVHSRKIKTSFYTGLRWAYRSVCFLVFVSYRVHSFGAQLFVG